MLGCGSRAPIAKRALPWHEDPLAHVQDGTETGVQSRVRVALGRRSRTVRFPPRVVPLEASPRNVAPTLAGCKLQVGGALELKVFGGRSQAMKVPAPLGATWQKQKHAGGGLVGCG